MHTLLLRLSGPLQSWGVQSRFSIRDSGLEPSKSGVLGLVCAALGVPRTADGELSRLARLRMGVRVDREGQLTVDYHTASNVLKAGGGVKDTEPSERYYLADALFLVGLADDDLGFLQALHAALGKPTWPLYLGRKAFVPGEPVWLQDGLGENQDLLPALRGYPYLGRRPAPERLRLVIEDAHGAIVRPDQPLSFDQRRFGPRRLTVFFIPTPSPTLEA